MLAISKTEKSDSCIVNILPCRINHDGRMKITKRHWITSAESDGTRTAHFRGRRLRGRVIRLPDQYQAFILNATDKTIVEPPPLVDDEDEEPEIPEPVRIVEQVSKVEEMIIWGHDQVPAPDSILVRSVDEWVAFAEAIHGR